MELLLDPHAAPLAETLGGSLVGLLSRVFHTTCAATLLGGTIYLRFVLAPAAAASGDVDATCFAGRRRAWATCVGICSLLLLASGLYNYAATIGSTSLLPRYHAVMGLKLILVVTVLGLSALLAGKTAAAEKVRGRMQFWLNITLAAILTIFVLGAYLRSQPHPPKVTVESEAPPFVPSPGVDETEAPAVEIPLEAGPTFPSLPADDSE